MYVGGQEGSKSQPGLVLHGSWSWPGPSSQPHCNFCPVTLPIFLARLFLVWGAIMNPARPHFVAMTKSCHTFFPRAWVELTWTCVLSTFHACWDLAENQLALRAVPQLPRLSRSGFIVSVRAPGTHARLYYLGMAVFWWFPEFSLVSQKLLGSGHILPFYAKCVSCEKHIVGSWCFFIPAWKSLPFHWNT